MKNLILFLFSFLFAFQCAFAQENNTQEGAEKNESTHQTVQVKSLDKKDQEISLIQDTISDNKQIIQQDGPAVTIVSQSGSNNVVEVVQKDSNNVSTIIQSGNGNRVKVKQSSGTKKKSKD